MSRAVRLLLPADLHAALRRHFERCYPEEGCALLIGRDGPDPATLAVTRIVPAPNLHPSPRRAFELDPQVHFAELRALRQSGAGTASAAERVIGHAHSHPDGAALPSARDRDAAFDPGMVWLILSVAAGKAGAAGAWMAEEEAGAMRFRPLGLVERPNPPPRELARQ